MRLQHSQNLFRTISSAKKIEEISNLFVFFKYTVNHLHANLRVDNMAKRESKTETDSETEKDIQTETDTQRNN